MLSGCSSCVQARTSAAPKLLLLLLTLLAGPKCPPSLSPAAWPFTPPSLTGLFFSLIVPLLLAGIRVGSLVGEALLFALVALALTRVTVVGAGGERPDPPETERKFPPRRLYRPPSVDDTWFACTKPSNIVPRSLTPLDLLNEPLSCFPSRSTCRLSESAESGLCRGFAILDAVVAAPLAAGAADDADGVLPETTLCTAAEFSLLTAASASSVGTNCISSSPSPAASSAAVVTNVSGCATMCRLFAPGVLRG